MRAIVVLALTACAITASGQRQEPLPNRMRELLIELHSSNDQKRIGAFETLRSEPANLKNPKIRAELIGLLDRENQHLNAELAEAQKKGYPDEGDNEPFAEYYSDVLGTVDSFADWNDPRQACILAESAYNDGSEFADEVARHAKTTMPCLLEKSRSTISADRATFIPVLVQTLAMAKDPIDATAIQAARDIVLRALRDRDDAVRAFTVSSLASYGGKDMIPALKAVAANDPSPEVEGHSIRKSAAQAILEIQKRIWSA